jgi:hypothetical protein
MAKVEVTPNGCWQWTGALTDKGYGRLSVGSRTDGTHTSEPAHRWSYKHFKGPIPDRLTIDHTCHNDDPACNADNKCLHRSCVNPDHLEATTIAVNILRGKGAAAKNKRRDSCRRGHPLSGENLRLSPGHRRCRECARIKQRERNRTETRKASNRRYASTEKARQSKVAYREKNREKSCEYQASYYAEHREEIEAKRRPYRESEVVRERNRAYQAEYYAANREKVAERGRAYREANKAKRSEQARLRYLRKKAARAAGTPNDA